MGVLKKPVPFGKYYLLERINVGGMAEVFKAKTFGVEGFERLLAVKRILPNIAEDEEFITMFIDEAKIAVQLQHANIAQIFDLGKVDESYFIALEYVNGRDLRSIFDRMRSRGEALPIAMACWIMMQICEGLDYAHNKRDGQGRELHLIHRDISPQNVLIGYDGEVKLIDFGIAKAAGKASTTQAGILKGKFGYMSPEQVRGLPIDKRSDIFAVGIVLYELLTGERLFVGETDFSTLEKVRNVEIVPPSSYNKKIPAELERLMLKALARDPEDRYSNAIDLHDDLQSFLYSIGEFYSRKDLAGWMKKTFAAEIEEDNAKIEQYRQIAPPVAASKEVSRRAAVAGAGHRFGAPPPPPPAAKGASARGPAPSSQMGWDDEELDTQIFDKTDENAEDKTVEQSAADLFFEDDDRTVANEPPPDILQQARPPEALATPKPERKPLELASEDVPGPTPPPLSLPRPSLPRRPTLTGVPPTAPRTTTRPLAPLPPPPAPPLRTTPAQLRRSGLNLPPVPMPPPPAPMPPPVARLPAPPPPPPAMPMPPPPRQMFRQPTATPFGTGSFSDEQAQAQAKRGGGFLKVALALLVLAGAGGGYYYWSASNKPGRIEVTATPDDATVLVDNTKVGDHAPVEVERPPGHHTISVVREGYVRFDKPVEVLAGAPLPLTVALEPSPDTGFELTSEPPGGLVWLDGAAIKGAAGQQARTDFRAFRIAPGHHILEIKGEARFKPWRQDVEVEPGKMVKVHVTLIPATGAGTPHAEIAMAGGPTPPPPPAHEATPPPPPPAPPPPTPHAAPPPPVAHEALVSPPPGAPHVAHHKKAHEALADEGGGAPVAAAPSDDDSGTKVDKVDKSDKSDKSGDCTMTVNSVPWSEVWIDGKNTTQHTPIVDYKIACGRHKLAFKRSDMQIDHSESITLKPGQAFKQRYTLATDE